MELNERIVLVTGANRGIGRALVERFLRSGATCVATARSEEASARLVAELQRYGDRALVEHVDISDESQVRALRDRVGERLRCVDILVNNAGVLLDEDGTRRPTSCRSTCCAGRWTPISSVRSPCARPSFR